MTNGSLASISQLSLLVYENPRYQLVTLASSTWDPVERWAGLGAYTWDADGDGALDLVLPGSHDLFSPACDCTIQVTVDVDGGSVNGGLLVIPNAFVVP